MVVGIADAFAIIEVNIEAKESYNLGDRILFNYTIESDNDVQVTFIPGVQCQSVPIAPQLEKSINLVHQVPYTDSYFDQEVKDDLEPQVCKAYVRVLTPVYLFEQKTFSINTSPSFSLDVDICSDVSCDQESKVFVVSEMVYINTKSSIEGTKTSGSLILPGISPQIISLPYFFKPNRAGTYELEVTASKQGYKTETIKEQFAVIEKEPKIKQFLTNDYELPKEEQKRKKTEEQKSNLTYYSLGILIFIVLIFLIYKRKPKFKNGKISNTEQQLRNYIKEAKKSGQSEEEIRNELLNSRWPEELIEKYLDFE